MLEGKLFNHGNNGGIAQALSESPARPAIVARLGEQDQLLNDLFLTIDELHERLNAVLSPHMTKDGVEKNNHPEVSGINGIILNHNERLSSAEHIIRNIINRLEV